MLTIDMVGQDVNGTTEVRAGYFFHYDVKVNLTGYGGKHRMFLFTVPSDPGECEALGKGKGGLLETLPKSI